MNARSIEPRNPYEIDAPPAEPTQDRALAEETAANILGFVPSAEYDKWHYFEMVEIIEETLQRLRQSLKAAS